jgi:hypothetical protein
MKQTIVIDGNYKGALQIAVSKELRVLYVCHWHNIPEGSVKEPHDVISGSIAQLLYIALTGCAFEQSPNEADFNRAQKVREEIARMTNYTWGAERKSVILAHQVIKNWGLHITPWMFVTNIDGEGKPCMDAPEYYQEIDARVAA